MDCLLDTHALLWALFSPRRLSKSARALIEDRSNSVAVSAASFWEISLKYGLGKLELPQTDPEELPSFALSSGFSFAELSVELLATYHRLARSSVHRDPFDRLLAWQAIRNDCLLVSKDRRFTEYLSQGLKTFW